MSQPFTGGSPLDKGRPDESLTDFKRRVAEALNDPTVFMLLLNEFKDYMVQYLALNQPPLSVENLIGFSQYAARAATKIATNETTTSVTYTDLATTGPELTQLPNGQYLVLYGAYARISANTGGARMSIKVNGDEATDADATAWNVTDAAPGSGAIVVTLNEGSNTLLARYRSEGVLTATFADRWLIAIRTANL